MKGYDTSKNEGIGQRKTRATKGGKMKDSLGFANLIPSGSKGTRVDQGRSDRIDESEEPGTSKWKPCQDSA